MSPPTSAGDVVRCSTGRSILRTAALVASDCGHGGGAGRGEELAATANQMRGLAEGLNEATSRFKLESKRAA